METMICPSCYGIGMVDTGSSEPDNLERLCDVCRGEGRIDAFWLRFLQRQQLRLGQCTRCHSDALVHKVHGICYRCWREALVSGHNPNILGLTSVVKDA